MAGVFISCLSVALLIEYTLARHENKAEEQLTILVQVNAFVITYENGKLSGPGVDHLLNSIEGSQFLAISEPHGNRELPVIAASLFSKLQTRYGYGYLVVENGPFIMEYVNKPGIRGNLRKIANLAIKYPMSFHMNFAEELKMIAAIGRISDAEEPVVWGVDQVTGSLHLLDRLLESASNEQAVDLLHQIRNDAAEMELLRFKLPIHQTGRAAFLGVHADVERFETLKDVFQPREGSVEEIWIDALIHTSRIYRGQQGKEPGSYISNSERELWMKKQFINHYRRVEQNSGEKPKVILKLGHNHLVRGINYTGIPSLGNYVSEFSVYNDTYSVHIYVHPISENPESPYYGLLNQFTPLTKHINNNQWTLIDLKPFRSHRSLPQLPEITDEHLDLIHAWDYLLVIGNAALTNPADVVRLTK